MSNRRGANGGVTQRPARDKLGAVNFKLVLFENLFEALLPCFESAPRVRYQPRRESRSAPRAKQHARLFEKLSHGAGAHRASGRPRRSC